MKGMKGKLLKKMKSIGTVGYLKIQDRVLGVSASDGLYLGSCPKNMNATQVQNKLLSREATEKKKKIYQSCFTEQEPEVIDVAELKKDLEEDEQDMELDEDASDKENIGPPIPAKVFCFNPNQEISLRKISEASELLAPLSENRGQAPLLEIDVSSFRRPDLNSYSLFDPNLLAAFKQAVMDHMRMSEAERRIRIENEKFKNIAEEEEEEEEEQEPPSKAPRVEAEEDEDPLTLFDEKCPPGGADSVIFYTTTLQGIRKTFEGCNSIRFLLESFQVAYFERDMSMHSEFREELRRIFNGKAAAVPPKLFIRGRYIGGAEEVLGLHEEGKLRPLFKTVPIDSSNGPCEGCAGMRFVLCFKCNGSHKVIAENWQCNNCSNCNENGLIICPLCC